jgi:hypothetical protein
MRQLLRRVAVLSVISAAGIGLLAPLSARSASAIDPATTRLLAAAEQPAGSGFLLRTADGETGRERSATLSLASAGSPPLSETLGFATPGPTAAAAIEVSARIRPVATPRPRPAVVQPPLLRGDTVSGKATFYCCTRGYRGEAVVALPGALGGHYDPPPASRYVTICADRCARLPVVDYCACYWGTASQKVADLSPEAWAAITDKDRWTYGVVRVTIHLG